MTPGDVVLIRNFAGSPDAHSFQTSMAIFANCDCRTFTSLFVQRWICLK